MAAASPSPLAGSPEKTNGFKLSRLLIDGGTIVLRKVFDGFYPPARLSAGLTAQSSTLNTLLKKKVLRAAQWNKLFPPGGAAPDSNTFDITLLFLLLTNICGLSPPLLGWHMKPSPSDTSSEANLARVKFFRNELYGHVSSTGIDTPTFSSLWREISTVLVALGLDQTEIDRLKDEKCSAKDYLDVLLEWTKSEEDIRSHLADLLRSQNTTRHIIEEVRDTQLEDYKTIQESNAMLGEVHQSQNTTRCIIEELRQTQLEDHKTLQDSASMVGEVHQTQTKIHSTTEGLAKSQEERFESLQTGLQEVKLAVGELSKGRSSGSQEEEVPKHISSNLEEQSRKEKEYESFKKLAKIDPKKDVEYHAERYLEGTRTSIFTKVENWLDDRTSQNRVMVISGNAGMGKSVISAVVCKRMMKVGRLSGSHFCRHDNARQRNPKVMLQSLAHQLSESLLEYRDSLADVLSRNLGVELNDMEVRELFEFLFEGPLKELKDPGRNILMIVDGLDESEYRGRNELLDVISNHFKKLPCWIRVLVTARPEVNIAESLKSFSPIALEPSDEENLMDIKLLFKKQLSHLIPPRQENCFITELVKKSEGLILYAHLLIRFIVDNASFLTTLEVDSMLPAGVSCVYQKYFQRLEKELCKELNVAEEQFLLFLSALVAAKEPLLLSFATKVMLAGKYSIAEHRKLKKAQSCISALLPIRGDCIHFFHKSVKDWLTSKSCYGEHDFIVDVKEGHRIMCELCTIELNEVKNKAVDKGQFADTKRYALQFGVQHMVEMKDEGHSRSFEEIIKKYVVDLEIVYAKLCVNSASPSEDVVYVLKQEELNDLCKEIPLSLNNLMFILRKHRTFLREHPDALFQMVLNEGRAKLSCEARNLLETKYCELPYMEYLTKTKLHEYLQADFLSPSQVLCCDVSPQGDYLVMECREGTIHLWSLLTGEQHWIRPVRINKDIPTVLFGAHRALFSIHDSFADWDCGLSFYRSVVFHPDGSCVLPGELRQAYSLCGNLQSLFPESQCTFRVCSVSGDKTMILTDSPEDDKCIMVWSLTDGKEISRLRRQEKVLSFAWSPDGNMIALSLSTGSICVIDTKNDFDTLAEATPSKPCGMLKFSPDQRSLFGVHVPYNDRDHVLHHFSLRKGHNHTYSLDVSCIPAPVKFHSWDLESRTEAGFLLGDQFSFQPMLGFSRIVKWRFVLNEQSVLMSSPLLPSVSMLRNPNETTDQKTFSNTAFRSIVFSLNGNTIYAVNDESMLGILASDIKSENLKAAQVIKHSLAHTLLPVKDRVVVLTKSGCPEIWNFELSKCIQRWDNITGVTRLLHIAEELVACVIDKEEKKVANCNIFNTVNSNLELWDIEVLECLQSQVRLPTTKQTSPASEGEEAKGDKRPAHVVMILDTGSGKILGTIDIFNGIFVTCNTKCQFLTTCDSLVQVVDGAVRVASHPPQVVTFTKVVDSYFVDFIPDMSRVPAKFSPNGQFVIVDGHTSRRHLGLSQVVRNFSLDFCPSIEAAFKEDPSYLYVFDLISLKEPYTLCEMNRVRDFKFISDELCVVGFDYSFRRFLFRIFNVKSGAVLNVLEVDGKITGDLFTACPLKRLIAFLCDDDLSSIRIIHVNLPAEKGNRKSKSLQRR